MTTSCAVSCHRTYLLAVLALIVGQSRPVLTEQLEIWPKPGTDNIIQVPIGEQKVVTCRGDVPNPELLRDIKWYWPDGHEVREHDDPNRLFLQRNDDPTLLSLVFNSVGERDAGQYRCTASYANRQLNISFNLATYLPITFEDAKEDQFATEGEEYKIICRVRSNPAPIITWYKDHIKVNSTENYAIEADGLVIKNVTQSDEAVYKCWVVVYAMGLTRERFITLQVQKKPKILELEKEMEGVEGESVHMKCVGEGKPTPEIHWLLRGQPLYGLPRFTVDKYAGTLQIDGLRTEDHGTYSCIVKNDAGVAEGKIDLMVVTKPKMEEFLNMTTQVQASEVILTCRASGTPAPNIAFQKEGMRHPFILGTQSDMRIFQEQRRLGSDVTIGTLRIKDILRSDDGLYNCIATNGRVYSERMGHLTVEFPPSFNRTPGNQAWYFPGRSANMTCFAEAIPNATISWRFRDNPIPVNDNYNVVGLQSESTLQIRHPTHNDYGVYTCHATNKLDTTTHSIYLGEATVPGRIQQVITDSITARSISFKIAGPVSTGGPPVDYYVVQYKVAQDVWDERQAEKLWPIEESIITVEGLEPLRAYSFRFAAKNEVGRGEFLEKMDSTSKRAAPGEPLILTESLGGFAFTPYPDKFEIKWTYPQDNGEPIDQFEIFYIPVRNTSNNQWDSYGESKTLPVTASTTHYMLKELKPNTYYRVGVRAHNVLGWGNYGNIVIKTADSPHKHPGNTSVQAAPTSANLDITLIIVAAVIVVLLTIVLVDFACCRISKCGILFTISSSLCNKKKQGTSDQSNPKSKTNGEKHPLPDLESMDRFHNPSDLDDLPTHHAVSQPLITDVKVNGNGSNAPPANTFV